MLEHTQSRFEHPQCHLFTQKASYLLICVLKATHHALSCWCFWHSGNPGSSARFVLDGRFLLFWLLTASLASRRRLGRPVASRPIGAPCIARLVITRKPGALLSVRHPHGCLPLSRLFGVFLTPCRPLDRSAPSSQLICYLLYYDATDTS